MSKITPSQRLLAEIEAYCARCDVPPSTFGREAVGDYGLVTKMRKGRRVTLETAERIQEYMRSRPLARGNAPAAA
jgi:hypothetical protein